MYTPRTPTEVAKDLLIVDDLIMDLVRKRTDLIEEVGLGKLAETLQKKAINPIVNRPREDDRYTQIARFARTHDLSPRFAEALLTLLIGESCKIQMEHTQDGRYQQMLNDLKDPSIWYQHLLSNLLKLTELEADRYEQNYREASFATKTYVAHENTLIASEIAQIPREDRTLALDLGCATGRVTRMLAPHFDQAIGYDISQHMIAKARSYAASMPNVSFADAANLEDEDWSHGLEASMIVMNLGTASDFVDIDRVLERVAKALRKNGRFLLSFYNQNALMYLWKTLPWQPGLRASLNLHKQCLDVVTKTGPDQDQDQVLSIHAKAYTSEMVMSLLARHGLYCQTQTYPTLGAVLPTELFKEKDKDGNYIPEAIEKQKVIDAVDQKLLHDDLGAYIIATGHKA